MGGELKGHLPQLDLSERAGSEISTDHFFLINHTSGYAVVSLLSSLSNDVIATAFAMFFARRRFRISSPHCGRFLPRPRAVLPGSSPV